MGKEVLRNKKIKLRKDDNVIVIAGKEKGKKGKVLFIDNKNDRIVIEGVNQRKKFMRPSQENPKGGVVNIEAPMHISNVMYYDDKQKKGARIGYEVSQSSGKKTRVIKDKKNEPRKID